MSIDTDISVVIPAYNAARTIRATLDSVFAQTARPLEVLVMDDGSTDGTSAIVGEFGGRVRLLRQSNHGAAAARNALFAAARGHWIAPLDADDAWHANYLQLQVEAKTEFPGAVACFTSYTDFHGAGDPPIWREERPQTTRMLVNGAEFIDRYFERSAIALPSFSLLSRAWLRGLGETPLPNDLSGAEDTFLWYRAALDGAICLTSASGGYYRVLPGSLSNDRAKAYLMRIRAVQRIQASCLQGRDPQWRARVRQHLHSSCRATAKYLAGDGNFGDARDQLWQSMKHGFDAKSTLLLCLLVLPRAWQPSWPSRHRHIEVRE